MDDTYNFGGVEAFCLLFLDYILITDTVKVKIERMKNNEEAWGALNNQQIENWNDDVIAFEVKCLILKQDRY